MELKENEKKDTIEVDGEFVKAVAEAVVPALKDTVAETIKEAMVSATEKTVKKNVAPEGVEGDGEEPEEEEEKKEKVEESKEFSFAKACVALAKGRYDQVLAYNEKSLKAYAAKSGYGNTAVDADGGYLVPDPDFEAEVERLEEDYGVSFVEADVRRISGNSVKLNKKNAGFELTETNQAVAIPGVKFTIGQVTADLRKFTGIAPATTETDEDSAVDYWAEVAQEFAMARAQKGDELVFTDTTGDGTNANTKGVLEVAGTAALSVGSALTDIDWDDIMDAEVKVPSKSQKNGKWYMHRTIWTKLIQKKANASGQDGHYMFQPNPNNPSTPWGTAVVLVEVMPTATEVSTNTAFAVFGDLKKYRLYVKNAMELTILTEATVKDADGTDFNLATQDGKALRGVVRMLAVTKWPSAFCIVGTGTVS